MPCANPWGSHAADPDAHLSLTADQAQRAGRCPRGCGGAGCPSPAGHTAFQTQPGAEGPALSVSHGGACTVREPEDGHFLLLTILNEWNKSGKLQEQKLRLENSFTNNLSPAWRLDRLMHMMSHREDVCMIKPVPGLICNHWCHFWSQDVKVIQPPP